MGTDLDFKFYFLGLIPVIRNVMCVPKLSDLFELVKKSGNTKIGFDCETKVSPLDRMATRAPEEFVRITVAEIRKAGMATRMMVQSFDWSTLQVIQKEAPEIRTMYLSSPRTLAPLKDGKPSPLSLIHISEPTRPY